MQLNMLVLCNTRLSIRASNKQQQQHSSSSSN